MAKGRLTRHAKRSQGAGKSKTVRRKSARPKRISVSRRSKETKRVHFALARLKKAYGAFSARGLDVVALADGLGEAAVQRHTEFLVRELAERHFLRDVLALRDAFASVPNRQLPPEVEVLRALPDSLLRWFGERLHLSPYLDANQEIEIPTTRLSAFEFEGNPPQDLGQLIKVRVLFSGWKHSGKPLIPPRVELLEKAEESTRIVESD